MGIELGVGATIIGSAAAATAAGAVVAAAIDGLILGAVIGGITAAVTGGDIGQGLLVGAIGGAVMGGISGAFSVGSTGITAAGATTGTTASGVAYQTVGGGASAQLAAAEAATTSGLGAAGGGATLLKEGALQLGKEGVGVGVNGWSQIGAGVVTEGIKGYLGAEAAKDARADAREQAEILRAEAEKDRELKRELARMQLEASSAGGGSSGALEAARLQVAEQRRQFDVTNQREDEKRQRMSRVRSALSSNNTFVMPTTTKPSIAIKDIKEA